MLTSQTFSLDALRHRDSSQDSRQPHQVSLANGHSDPTCPEILLKCLLSRGHLRRGLEMLLVITEPQPSSGQLKTNVKPTTGLGLRSEEGAGSSCGVSQGPSIHAPPRGSSRHTRPRQEGSQKGGQGDFHSDMPKARAGRGPHSSV